METIFLTFFIQMILMGRIGDLIGQIKILLQHNDSISDPQAKRPGRLFLLAASNLIRYIKTLLLFQLMHTIIKKLQNVKTI